MYYINKNIENLYRTSYSDPRGGYLRLDMNENPKGLPQPFFEKVMKEITPEYISMYPEQYELVSKLAEKIKCNQNNVCLTNGSDDAIRLCFEVFGEAGKKVVSVSPSFEMYSVYSNMYGMKHNVAEYDENFNIDIKEILSLIDNETRIIAMLNPNSPIGNPWDKADIINIIKKSREKNAIVIIDEAYHYFFPETFLEITNEYDNVIILRTFSKLFSIAGCRLGYIVSNENIIDMVKRASSTYPVNCFAVKFAQAILENPDVEKHLIEEEKCGRQYLLSKLEKSNYEIHHSGANYILIKPNSHPKEIFNQLKARNILIKIYSNPILKNWIRITTADIESMKIFWKEFKMIDG
ncbi:pyridoxal phosphate-dependent aminotransferase [Paraclostridium bifermentans]|uniref:pyridoxal phosphate-dependent aminotransferase n=1 Tax=Paraclostridium bifermentans TaxID=1490 RepID=UPI00189BBD40|nr:histidinol-phosphate transaminase [Paraclostridium bifermentans]